MAAFEAVERLQKFDWLIQKLHSLRSTFNSEQGIQELQKLHALQLLHRNGIPFNESLGDGDNEDDRMLEEKINTEEDEPEDDDELEDIEEDTEVLDDLDDEENEENRISPKSESEVRPPSTTNITSNGSLGNQGYGLQPKNGMSLQTVSAYHPHKEDVQDESEINSDKLHDQQQPGGDSEERGAGGRYGRFPTGLFPPLPFDPIIGQEDSQQIKVGTFCLTFGKSLLASTNKIGVKLTIATLHPITPHLSL